MGSAWAMTRMFEKGTEPSLVNSSPKQDSHAVYVSYKYTTRDYDEITAYRSSILAVLVSSSTTRFNKS